MLIADNFYGPFIAFISLLAIPITAWLGVFLVDMIKRRYYDPTALLDMTARSAYWYRGGIEWRATASWAVAIVIGYLLLGFGLSSIGWIVTFAVAALAYLGLGGARGVLTAPVRNAVTAGSDDRG
jgi:cytosine/uracil/thiamine/allantoin permease